MRIETIEGSKTPFIKSLIYCTKVFNVILYKMGALEKLMLGVIFIEDIFNINYHKLSASKNTIPMGQESSHGLFRFSAHRDSKKEKAEQCFHLVTQPGKKSTFKLI